MENLKLTPKSRLFVLSSQFIGNGLYYITEQGSRVYKNTPFGSFYSKNPTLVKIISKGNDAQRCGKTGDFFIVEFSKEVIDIRLEFDLKNAIIEREKETARLLKEVETPILKAFIKANWELCKALRNQPLQISLRAGIGTVFTEREIKSFLYV